MVCLLELKVIGRTGISISLPDYCPTYRPGINSPYVTQLCPPCGPNRRPLGEAAAHSCVVRSRKCLHTTVSLNASTRHLHNSGDSRPSPSSPPVSLLFGPENMFPVFRLYIPLTVPTLSPALQHYIPIWPESRSSSPSLR